MTLWCTMIKASIATAYILGGLVSHAWGQGPGTLFGGELSGLTTFTGQVLCVGCNVEEVRDAHPNLFNLYQFNNRQEQFVMQIRSFSDSSERHYWQSVAGLADEVTVRAPDQVLEALTEEENLFKPITVTGILRSTRMFDIDSVRVRG